MSTTKQATQGSSDITATGAAVAWAFNEWMRRYIEEPERFAREFQEVGAYQEAIAEGREPDYGKTCASYLRSLVVLSRL